MQDPARALHTGSSQGSPLETLKCGNLRHKPFEFTPRTLIEVINMKKRIWVSGETYENLVEHAEKRGFKEAGDLVEKLVLTYHLDVPGR